MSLHTTLMKINYGPKLGESFPETVEGFTVDDAVADILAGTHDGRLHAVYSINGDKCIEISELVADRIAAAWIAGQFVSPMAKEFIDYMGREVRERAA